MEPKASTMTYRIVGRFDPNPFDDGDEVNPFAEGSTFGGGLMRTSFQGEENQEPHISDLIPNISEKKDPHIAGRFSTEFLEREVSSMEIENKKFDDMVTEYLKALEELEYLIVENGFLQRKVKKMRGPMSKRNSKIEAQEEELKEKENVIGEFEREVKEMRMMISLLRDEKNEVL
ncbi:hypothetical protein L6452_03630 [Arctium lappa]|uniref:Uncharacterized protein n=1 Tax=Arctium lappa TaxID=4217 RepID=A0ACB9FMV4_ARCLA|nr:hypothetical protein L6452_03630 [Arctium lappa]